MRRGLPACRAKSAVFDNERKKAMWKNTRSGLQAGTALAAAFCLGFEAVPVYAGTVAYWPLAYENGVRMTSSSRLDSFGSADGLKAYPVALDGSTADEVQDGEDCFPLGTSAFPAGYGVYDSAVAVVREASTGLYFKTGGSAASGYTHGGLKVDNAGGVLSRTTFTVECFVRRQAETPRNNGWNTIAAVPRTLDNNGTKVINCDAWGFRVIKHQSSNQDWGQLSVRFNPDTITYKDSNPGETTGSTTVNSGLCKDLWDGAWHHVAFSVDDSTHEVKVYFDYQLMASSTLGFSVTYGSEALRIGASPETPNPFGGSMAHFRISDEALSPDRFLQFTRSSPADSEADDVLLHINFDKVGGLSSNGIVFNEAARGSPVRIVASGGYPAIADGGLPTDAVRASLVAAGAAANTGCMTNIYATQATSYYEWFPDDSSFTNGSFTVECFYRTTENRKYHNLLRRRGSTGTQFVLNMNGPRLRGSLGTQTTDDPDASNDGAWHHAAVVYDMANTAAKRVLLYRDYRLVASNTYNAVTVSADTIPVCIGGLDGTDGTRTSFGGCMDDVRITARALTPGEFMTASYFDPSSPTLAWASFDSTFDSSVSAHALADGAGEAGAGGKVPSCVPFASGRDFHCVDGRGKVLRKDDLGELSLENGMVKYPSNPLLALGPDQTVEFIVEANAPPVRNTGLLRCNATPDAGVPSWSMSMDTDGSLMLRCAFRKDDGSFVSTANDENGINGDTDVVVADGQRHHLALVLEETEESGANFTTVSVYKDYGPEPAWSKKVAGRIYYSCGSSVWLGGNSASDMTGRINELRISNGVVAVADMIRSKTKGFIILFR